MHTKTKSHFPLWTSAKGCVACSMSQPPGNWLDKRPDIRERLTSRLSIHGASTDSLGGLPELTNADYAAALGTLNNLHQLVLGAICGDWPAAHDQLREAALRRSWNLWRERHRQGSWNIALNTLLVDQVLRDWPRTQNQRLAIGDTQRAKDLGVDYRRYKGALKAQHRDVLAWLDATTTQAFDAVRSKLRN